MTQEQRTSLIKGALLVMVFAGIVTGAWVSSMSDKDTAVAKTTNEKVAPTPAPVPDVPLPIVYYQIPNNMTSQQLADLIKTIVSPENGLAIAHFHLAGNPDSERLADILDKVRKKHGRRVLVVRLTCEGHPLALKSQGVTKLPHVMMIVGTKKVFEFQGLWSQQRVDQKVDEILHGLVKRIGKDWRPPVPGMTPAGK